MLSLLPLPLLAQTVVRGIVTEQNSGNRPIPGVQIKALGSTPELSDNAGAFRLAFAAKKPGDRIVVTGITKAGYELVNRDILSAWVIESDPQARTKIVMCPEGALARNMARYYDISLAALTRGYTEQLRRLQAERDSARLDAKAYAERAQELADRFAGQQGQLEDLAERFARENFDDCPEVQRAAFEAFSAGNVDGALRILESIDSKEEIAKAKAQKEKGARMTAEGARRTAEGARMTEEGNAMQVQSDSIIRQNIGKLIFQGKLYATSNRFEDAEKVFAAAAEADTTFSDGVSAYAEFLNAQHRYEECLRWFSTALAAARSLPDRIMLRLQIARAESELFHYAIAERMYEDAIDTLRVMAGEEPFPSSVLIAVSLTDLAEIRWNMDVNSVTADTSAWEAVTLLQHLVTASMPKDWEGLRFSMWQRLGGIQQNIWQRLEPSQEKSSMREQAEASFRQALLLAETRSPSEGPSNRYAQAQVLSNLAIIQPSDSLAEPDARHAAACLRELAAMNPAAYAEDYAVSLVNLAGMHSRSKRDDSSEAWMLEAIAIMERIAIDNPRRGLPMQATAVSKLAWLYNGWRESGNALRCFARCVDLRRRLAEETPEAFQSPLLTALYSLADCYARAGKADSAEVLYVETVDLARRFVEADPARHQAEFPVILNQFAWDTYRSNLPRAVACAREAIGRLLALPAGIHGVQDEMVSCCARLARYLILSRQFSEAESFARQSLEASGNNRRYTKNLAHSLLYQGRVDEALPLYETLNDLARGGNPSFKEAALGDFDEFERAGVTHPDVARIRALLTTPQESGK